MRVDFSSGSMEARGSGRIFFKCWKKELSTQNPKSSENILEKEKENMTFSAEGNLEMCHQQTYVKEISEESSLIKQVLKEGILGHQEEEWIIQRVKKWE